ncbi:MAG TPA: 16S rRNA (uracil(1498)-N(3))-methyltransferase [Stellaceae bacterium]|nr:16S rRNA (uracil(1498)-N(3))-methyltransferase [Stellaceae bacterium]
MAYRSMTRLYVDAPLEEGAALPLSVSHAHYLKTVLRLAEGAEVALFNGSDGEFLARIDAMDRRTCTLKLGARQRRQGDEGDLWLAFAPVKRARIDYLVEKATELGVSAIQPVTTARTNVARVNLDRLRANMIEAAEQSQRLSVPRLEEPKSLGALLETWPRERQLVLCDESGNAPPIAPALKAIAGQPCAVLIGPEGGFADSELDALRKLPFVCAVGLGPRVLRADTAALAALAVVQALIGDWSSARRR